MAPATLYSIFGVSPGASDGEVKTAFRRAALICHPDRSDDPEAAVRFRVLHSAYTLLLDRDQRRRYDATLGPEELHRLPVEDPPKPAREIVLDLLNRVLWMIDDILRAGESSGGDWVAHLLERIEREVLEPAGFPDYFHAARGIPSSTIVSGHRRYTGNADRYRAIRLRADRLFRRITLLDLAPLVDTVLAIHDEAVSAFPPTQT